MATLDIRKCECEAITDIKFNESTNRIYWDGGIHTSAYIGVNGGTRIVISKSDVDNLIKALQKAKELWG